MAHCRSLAEQADDQRRGRRWAARGRRRCLALERRTRPICGSHWHSCMDPSMTRHSPVEPSVYATIATDRGRAMSSIWFRTPKPRLASVARPASNPDMRSDEDSGEMVCWPVHPP